MPGSISSVFSSLVLPVTTRRNHTLDTPSQAQYAVTASQRRPHRHFALAHSIHSFAFLLPFLVLASGCAPATSAANQPAAAAVASVAPSDSAPGVAAASSAAPVAPETLARFHPTRPDNPLGTGGFPYSHGYLDKPEALRRGPTHLTRQSLSGAAWARQDFWWSLVNPEKDVWDWEFFDRAMESYGERGIRLLAILCYGSPWATSGGGDAPVTEAEREAYGDYVYEMVRRYRGVVSAWEIWNEPNILPYWSPRPDPADYAALLRHAYRRAKEADPDAVIVGGVMAGPDFDFLEGMYRHGAARHFDVLAFHTYSQNPDEYRIALEAARLRAILRRHGDDRPVWLTETGVYTGPAGVGEAVQAEMIARVTLGLVGSGEVEKIFQLTLDDWSDDPQAVDATSFRGLTTHAGRPKPAFWVHRRLADALAERTGLGWVALDPALRAVAFGHPSHPLLALWLTSDDPTTRTVTLDLATPLVAVTSLATGAVRLGESPDGRHALEIGRFPILVEGCGVEIGARALLRLSPEPPVAVAGQTTRLSLHRLAFPELPAPWVVEFEPPAGWSVEPRRVSLGADARPVEVAIRVPLDEAAETAALGFSIRSPEFGGGEPVRLATRVEVRPPYELDWAAQQWLDPDAPAWAVRLANRIAAPIAVEIAATDGGAALEDGGPRTLTLAAQEEATAVFPLRLAPGALPAELALEARARVAGVSEREFVAALDRVVVGFPRVATPPTIDGNLDDWTHRPPTLAGDRFTPVWFNPSLYKGDDDLSAEAWFAWDDEYLYFAIRATDDDIRLPSSPTIWDFDSLQMGFDFAADTPPGVGYDERDDVEIGIAQFADGSQWFDPYRYPEGRPAEPLLQGARVHVAVDRERHRIVYEGALPWAGLPLPEPPRRGTLFAFNFILNDNDGGGRQGWLEFRPGIGWGKDPAEFALAWLLEE